MIFEYKSTSFLGNTQRAADLGGATPRTALGDKTFDMAGANDVKYPPLPDIAKERSNRM